MIGVLQSVGVAEANQLQFVTGFQNIYVQLQSEVPVFSQGDKIQPPPSVAPSTLISPVIASSTQSGQTINSYTLIANTNLTSPTIYSFPTLAPTNQPTTTVDQFQANSPVSL